MLKGLEEAPEDDNNVLQKMKNSFKTSPLGELYKCIDGSRKIKVTLLSLIFLIYLSVRICITYINCDRISGIAAVFTIYWQIGILQQINVANSVDADAANILHFYLSMHDIL